MILIAPLGMVKKNVYTTAKDFATIRKLNAIRGAAVSPIYKFLQKSRGDGQTETKLRTLTGVGLSVVVKLKGCLGVAEMTAPQTTALSQST